MWNVWNTFYGYVTSDIGRNFIASAAGIVTIISGLLGLFNKYQERKYGKRRGSARAMGGRWTDVALDMPSLPSGVYITVSGIAAFIAAYSVAYLHYDEINGVTGGFAPHPLVLAGILGVLFNIPLLLVLFLLPHERRSRA